MLICLQSYSRKFEYNQLAPDERAKPHLYALDKNDNPWSPGWVTINLKMNYRLTNGPGYLWWDR
jgi:hemoglobin/transferrin/lactoferrin receptor protein